MTTYANLPQVGVELLDGNLRVDNTNNAKATIIIGRSETGTTGRVYTVTDTNIASNIYGSTSPLIRKMNEVLAGGATKVLLYRIGGSPAKLEGIFGDGSYIATAEESVNASNKFRIYIGPRPTNDGKSCLIVFKGKDIVYSNVPGSEIDLRQVTVSGFDPDTAIKIGTPTEPVLFANVIPTEKARKVSYTGNGTVKDYSLPSTTKVDEVKDVKVLVNKVEKTSGTDYTFANDKVNNRWTVNFTNPVDAGHKIEISYSVKPTGNESGTAVFAGDGTTKKFKIQGTKTTDDIEFTKVTVANVDKKADATLAVSDDNLARAVEFTDAPDNQKTILVEYIVKKTLPVVPGKFLDGEDNIDTTWKKYFELLHSALLGLENVPALSIVTDSAIIDAPNIVDGSTAEDKLDYVYVEEEDGILKYEWSEKKVLYRKGTDTTPDQAQADINGNGQPIIAKRYHEANFAHLLANFAYSISENEDFALVTIGTSQPATLSAYDINKWIGTPPSYDNLGNIVANGTGLLGLRNMVERSGVRQGFYKTDTGFVDGNVQSDSNGAPIDIGKYLSVVPQIVITQNLGNATIANGAGVYAGLITTIDPGNSTTNVPLYNVGLPAEVKKVKLDQLAGAGYVMFNTKNNVVRVVSGELATNINSDYDYLSTTLIVAETINRVRNVCIPYIGKGLTQATLVALDTAIESELQNLAEANVLIKFKHVVNQRQVVNGRGALDVAITIVPPFELREINVSMKLSVDL